MERSTAIETALRSFYEILTTRDIAALRAFVTADRDAFVGVGIDGEAEDGQTWLDGFAAQLTEEGEVRRTMGEDPRCFAEGTVGWFVDRPTLHWPDGHTEQPRLTGVLRLEDGVWRLVSLHASLEPPEA